MMSLKISSQLKRAGQIKQIEKGLAKFGEKNLEKRIKIALICSCLIILIGFIGIHNIIPPNLIFKFQSLFSFLITEDLFFYNAAIFFSKCFIVAGAGGLYISIKYTKLLKELKAEKEIV